MSDEKLDRLDYYTLLRVRDDATEPQIRRAFKKFARRYHPDRFADEDPIKRARAERIYRRGSEAVQVLTDPVARAAYDQKLRQGVLRLAADELDRAHRRAKKGQAVGNDGPRISSAEARAYFDKALELARGGDWLAAWRACKRALELEPQNAFLETRLSQIEARLRAHQRPR